VLKLYICYNTQSSSCICTVSIYTGTDPATDLRGGGCASLINLLYLTNTPRLKSLSQSIYTLSKHPTQVGFLNHLCYSIYLHTYETFNYCFWVDVVLALWEQP